MQVLKQFLCFANHHIFKNSDGTSNSEIEQLPKTFNFKVYIKRDETAFHIT